MHLLHRDNAKAFYAAAAAVPGGKRFRLTLIFDTEKRNLITYDAESRDGRHEVVIQPLFHGFDHSLGAEKHKTLQEFAKAYDLI